MNYACVSQKPSEQGAAVAEPLLEVRGIVKEFPGVRVLAGVDFDVRPGEVHALCGENGAGKSTLMRILAGNIQADAGDVYFRGQSVRFASPLDAKNNGILLIHQEVSLVSQLSVAENIYLGSLPAIGGIWVNWRKLLQDAATVIRDCDIPISPHEIVGTLSVAKQQMVEIARALAFKCSVVIFDEPTASLTEKEAKVLFANIDLLRRQGVGIVYISHKMGEIFQISDRITVLRDGERCATVKTSEVDENVVTNLMIGRSIESYFERPRGGGGREVLRVQNIAVNGYVDDISFAVREGEVLGLYGLVGSGRSEIAEAIFGVRPRVKGDIFIDGYPATIRSPADAMRYGIALVPEDRKKHGLVLSLGGGSNIALPLLRLLGACGFVRVRKERALFMKFADQLNIRAASISIPARMLSGGNQQKVVLAKWLATQPKIIILDEPTRGIDVGAKAEVHALVKEFAESGMAVLLISSEMPEIMGLSNRILTVYGGRINDEIHESEFSEEKLVSKITGLGSAAKRAAEMQLRQE